jgi:ABC-2 type transport system permease protein
MRIQAIFKRILLQRRSDKRSLTLLFIAPLIILSLLYLLMQVPSNQTYRVGLIKPSENASLTEALKKSEQLDIIEVADNSRDTMNRKDLAAIVELTDKKVDITYANKDTGSTQIVSSLVTMLTQKTQAADSQGKIKTAIESTLKKAVAAAPELAGKLTAPDLSSAGSTDKLKITSHYLYGDAKLNPFDNLAPISISFFVFFFVFLISGISLVNERGSGTLIRMLISPVKRTEIISGYTLAYGLLAVVQTILVVLWARFVLQMSVIGNFAWVIIINLLVALIALLLGLLLSTLAKTEFQFVQFIPIVVVPQFLFSGIINIETMAQPLQWIAHILPLYYGVDALQKVIKQGMGLSAIGLDLTILLAVVILLYLLNVIALKNLRKV